MKSTFLSLFAGFIALGIGLMTMAFKPAPQTTTILLVKHAETIDGTCTSALTEQGSSRAMMLADLFKTTSLEQIYACGNQGTGATVSHLAAGKGLKAKRFETADLRKSVFNMYSENTGKTIVICADDEVLAQILDLLIGEKGSADVKKDNRGTIYQVKSQSLGKGTFNKIPYATHLN
jgi:hypothetical protein